MSKQSLLSDNFLRTGLEPIKNFITEVTANIEAEVTSRMEGRFREINSTLIRNIHHYERVLKAVSDKQSQAR